MTMTSQSDSAFPAHATEAITILEGFAALTRFLEAFWERDGKPDDSMMKLLSWVSSGAWSNGGPNDPAMWADWLDAVGATRRASPDAIPSSFGES